MSQLSLIPKNELLIREAYDDFILSRKASLLSQKTIEFYIYTVGGLVEWLISIGVTREGGNLPN